MPEERQIGRRPCIGLLERKLTMPANQWLIGPRRIGKTSVAKAVLARVRKRGSVAIDVDLSSLEISTATTLAGQIARQAQAARAGEAMVRAQALLRKGRGRAKGMGKALSQLGFEDTGEALTAAAAILAEADDGAPGLDKVLGALALHAGATDRRAYLLLDEVHLLADLESAEGVVARWCKKPNSPLVFVFAGSEESAAEELRETGQPLAAIGEEFELTEIAREDWIPGLRERFEEVELKVETTELERMLTASNCHPRRTMLIASRVRVSATSSRDWVASPTLVELAIEEAERDRSWL
jgi:hypothetical protein